MNTLRPFIYSAALLPDERILAKVNMRDDARALDKFIVIEKGDELYDEGLTNAVSYALLLDNGALEIKARFVDSDSPAGLDRSTRKKAQFGKGSHVYDRLGAVAGPFQTGKQVWLDLPKGAK
jgi:hypothetical protein